MSNPDIRVNLQIPDFVKILMMRGEKGDRPTITETPIDNGHEVTFSYDDGESVSFSVNNATSGDYLGLINKPKINNVLISGDKTGGDYGLVNVADVYTKDDFVVVEVSHEMAMRETIIDAVAILPSSMIDIDDYILLSVQAKMPRAKRYGVDRPEWMAGYIDETKYNVDPYPVTDVKLYPTISRFYVESDTPKIEYSVYNQSDVSNTVTFRAVFLKIG